MDLEKQKKWLLDLYIVDVLAITGMVVAALVMQFALQELPCPLCLLQRFGIMGMSAGFLMNLRFGIKTSHYALSLLAAIYTSFVALRQMTLHILPGDLGYGSALFGLHLYTWVFIVSVLMILFITVLLLIEDQFKQSELHLSDSFQKWIHACFFIITMVMVINLVSTFLECGLKQCPDNPVVYRFLNDELI